MKRVALEEKMKFTDKIEEQQKILNKLRMQQELNEFLAAEAVYEEALKEEKPPGYDDMDLELPKETENMIDRFMNHASYPTLPTTTATSLLPPLMNENNGHPLVTSHSDTGHPPHLELSDNTTLPDMGLPKDPHFATGHQVASHPSNVSKHEPRYYVEITEQLASSLKTNNPRELHHRTGIPTPQISAISANIPYSRTSHPTISSSTTTYTSPAETSTPIASLPQRPTSTGIVTSHHHTVPLSSSKPMPSPSYKLRGDADVFTPKSSPTTLYHEIRPSQFVESQNRAFQSSDSVSQIAEALAKVTQLQRLPQAKPDVFTGDETDTKFFTWETAFDALIDSAPISAQQKLYLLYQHLDGNAKKVVEQLQYMVGASPEIAYNETRKKLKSRFGRPAIIATDFENKLVNWPKMTRKVCENLTTSYSKSK